MLEAALPGAALDVEVGPAGLLLQVGPGEPLLLLRSKGGRDEGGTGEKTEGEEAKAGLRHGRALLPARAATRA